MYNHNHGLIHGLNYNHTTAALQAAHPAGPYVAATKNYVVLTGSCYFARFFRGPAMELLVTHQSDSHQGRTYIAPYKEAAVDDEGVMRMMFWAANEGFKAEAVPTTRSKAGVKSRNPQVLPANLLLEDENPP